MSAQIPLTLYELAKQRMLATETTDITDLQELPNLIFHEIFIEAFIGEHNEALKVMVQAWPFPCLPLRTLMDLRKPNTRHPQVGVMSLEHRNIRSLEALLDGIDMQLSRKAQHSRWKLQVLDWRHVHQDFWTVGPRALTTAHSEDASGNDTGKPGLRQEKPTLKILADLCFEDWDRSHATEDELQRCLLIWARDRRASVHIHSEKVMINSDAGFKILRLLHAVQLDSIHELEVFINWSWKSMKVFVSQLKKMTNLQKLHFSSLSPEVYMSQSQKRCHVHIYAFHLGQLHSLRKLHIHNVFFLYGILHKVLRSETHLEALTLSSSPLKESDLQHLSQCPSTSQLKSLTLRKFSMESFNPETLRVLLDQLAHTLEHLALEQCGLTDPQMLALLPALSRCSQLKTFSCYGNLISLGVLQELLCVSAGLSQLTEGLYPAPLESYKSKIPARFVHPEKFSWVCAELEKALRDIRPSLRVQICTFSCDVCKVCQLYRLEPSGNWEVTEECLYQSNIRRNSLCIHYAVSIFF